MERITKEVTEKVITPVVAGVLNFGGLETEILEDQIQVCVDNWLNGAITLEIVIVLLYEAVSQGYVLGLDNATTEGVKNLHNTPS